MFVEVNETLELYSTKASYATDPHTCVYIPGVRLSCMKRQAWPRSCLSTCMPGEVCAESEQELQKNGPWLR